MVIGISGKYKSGKDTLAEHLYREHGFERIAFARALKEGCRAIFDLSEEQVYGTLKSVVDARWGMTPGEILQKVGTDLFRNHFDRDIWVNTLGAYIASRPHIERWVITDVRFQNEADYVLDELGGIEADYVLDELGGILLRIDRKNRDTGGRDPNHLSETALDNYERFTYRYQNDASLGELFAFGESVLKEAIAA